MQTIGPLNVCDDEGLAACGGRRETVLCDGPCRNTFKFSTEQRVIGQQRPDGVVASDRRGRSLFAELHDHIGFAAQWQGVWEPFWQQCLATEAGMSTTSDVAPDKSVPHDLRPGGPHWNKIYLVARSSVALPARLVWAGMCPAV